MFGPSWFRSIFEPIGADRLHWRVGWWCKECGRHGRAGVGVAAGVGETTAGEIVRALHSEASPGCPAAPEWRAES